ncbi:MAG: patatin-like phospholipase family protein [Pseudomonadales bacterium]|nr:patatin-like phospholipase family protein [Pseudomonadales bacterium]MCP5331467.1 patatin-like phospholipase family protein [Pseudomonadales bacterium]MCP5343350.1 patatin-like phospholipase family protein [Pseudomonadales bacterium]
MQDSQPPAKKALVLSGGGARGAYQVGVLRAIANLLPHQSPNPFQIITGASAGSLNAAAVASSAQRLRTGVRALEYVWKNISSEQVYRLDSSGLISNASNWVFSFLSNRRRNTPTSLLDNAPLEALLEKVIKFDRVTRNIERGFIQALAVTASGYSSGESVSFYQGVAGLKNWEHPHRIGIRTQLTIKHLMASTAIPTLFPAVRINREYFGDGAIRQLAPLSPAIQLGADRILAIGVSSKSRRPEKGFEPTHPSLTQILAHILNSAFVDTMTNDIEILRRYNRMVPLIPPELAAKERVLHLRNIDLLDITPSENLNDIASDYFDSLPRALKLFVRDAGSSTVLSLLMFEKCYTSRLIELGYNDAMEKEQEILAFFRED